MMMRQFLKLILSLILISSIFCSFGFGRTFAFNTQSNHRQNETSIDSHQDGFPGVIVDDYRNPPNRHFKSFLRKEWESEEVTKKKQEILCGDCSNVEQSSSHVNAPPVRFGALSACHLYYSPLYLLFEVLLL